MFGNSATLEPTVAVEKSSVEDGGLSLIDYLAEISQKPCENPSSPLLFGTDKVNKKSIMVKASCDMWNCAPCAARKTRRWMARALNGTRILGGQWYFMTITPKDVSVKNGWSLKNLRSNWNKLKQRIKYHFGDFEYLKTFEPFKKKGWHMHFLLNAEIPYKETGTDERGNPTYECQWLEDNASECGMGWKTDYQPIRSPAGTAFYVCKYLTKVSGDNTIEWPHRLRRIEASHGFPKLPDLTEESELEWTYVKSTKHLTELAMTSLENGEILHGKSGHRISIKGLVNEYLDVRTPKDDQRTDSDGSSKDGNAETGKLDAEPSAPEGSAQGQHSRKPSEHGKERRTQALHQDISKRTEQSPNDIERILDDGLQATIQSQSKSQSDKPYGASVPVVAHEP